jgi:RNA polymerase sigma-70 factor (sigma-E family)
MAMELPHAAEAFCRRIRPRLVGTLVLYCNDPAAGEELAQEALARAIERWDRVSTYESPDAWVFRVGLNLARSWQRRRRAQERVQRKLIVQLHPYAAVPPAEATVAVRDLVSRLPARQRAVVITRFYAGLSVEETAKVLGCAPGTVTAHTHRALRRLRADLEFDEPRTEE